MVLKFRSARKDNPVFSRGVSVPLRGYGFEIDARRTISEFRAKFPSPCGDMVLKLRTKGVVVMRLKMFPSPCGDMVLKFVFEISPSVAFVVFPSPCGDMVLKFLGMSLVWFY